MRVSAAELAHERASTDRRPCGERLQCVCVCVCVCACMYTVTEVSYRPKHQQETERRAAAAAAPKYLSIAGPPGCIKGQLVELLVNAAGLKHVSPGEAIRDAIKNQTPAGVQVTYVSLMLSHMPSATTYVSPMLNV